MIRTFYSLVLEIGLTAWIKRVRKEGYDRWAAERTLMNAVEKRFDEVYDGNT